jgi:hypothetical protein
MTASRQGGRQRAPIALAVAIGAAVGLCAAAATAAPVQAVWQAHVLPAFSQLLSTLAAYC